MVPQPDPEQPAPLTLQVTAVFVLPVTFVSNCCCPPTATVALVGEMVTETGGITVTVADPDLVLSELEIAVTLTCGGFGTVAGAV
jgi:hypothetical protein